jgi:hypothetical protein
MAVVSKQERERERERERGWVWMDDRPNDQKRSGQRRSRVVWVGVDEWLNSVMKEELGVPGRWRRPDKEATKADKAKDDNDREFCKERERCRCTKNTCRSVLPKVSE